MRPSCLILLRKSAELPGLSPTELGATTMPPLLRVPSLTMCIALGWTAASFLAEMSAESTSISASSFSSSPRITLASRSLWYSATGIRGLSGTLYIG